MTDTTTTTTAGPALMAEGLRRLAEADASIKAATGSIDDRGASPRNRFNGESLTGHNGDVYVLYAQHLRETGHSLILAAQTAAMLASGITLPADEQQAWDDALGGVGALNQPAAPRRPY
jgi:hypothetical protein